MITKLFKRNTYPAVKSVSTMIKTKSHKQRKYLTLMLVPSASNSKTYSLSIPRFVFYVVGIGALAVITIIFGFYMRSTHFEQVTHYLSVTLDETQEAFDEFQQVTETTQFDLLYDVARIHNQISERYQLYQHEQEYQENLYQDALNYLWMLIDEFEYTIDGFEQERLGMIDTLRTRTVIAPLANILHELEDSQELIRAEISNYHIINGSNGSNNPNGLYDYDETAYVAAPVVGVVAFGEGSSTLSTPMLLERLGELMIELEIQRQLLYDIEVYKYQIDAYIANNLPGFNPERTSAYGVELLHWSYARRLFRLHVPMQVTDVRTGITYWVSSFSNGNHADVRPVSAADTAAMHRTFGGTWSWTTRPVLVTIEGRTFAASINGMPHGGGSIPGNNMHGHICIHFFGSRTHSGALSHERDHQNSVQEAFRAQF